MPGRSPEHVHLHEPLPDLHEPTLVGMLTGWIDASGAAAAALAAVEAACDMRTIATFDGDEFIDYRARRPTMELRDGVNTRLVWPEIELKAGRDEHGRDVLVLSGPEPDAAWHRFADVATDLAISLGVRLAVFLGAYPFATPHTRPSRVSSSSPSADAIAALPFLKSSIDVPAGMAAVLEHAFLSKGVPALGIWAQVPHYLGAMSCPAATLALMDGLALASGLAVGGSGVRAEAAEQRQRLDQLVEANSEHRAMIEQLETLYDQAEQQTFELDPDARVGTDASGPMADQAIPSADELAAEFERFLRDQES